MGDLIVKRGNVSVEYGNFSTTDGTVTWVSKINPDNSYNIVSVNAGNLNLTGTNVNLSASTENVNFLSASTVLASIKAGGNVVIGNAGVDGMGRTFSVYGIGQFSDRLKVGSTGTAAIDATFVMDAANGGFTRLSQWTGSSGIALNLMHNGTTYHSWGVDSSHRWNITPNATTFGTTGLMMNTTGYCSIGIAPDTTHKLLASGPIKSIASVAGGANYINAENGISSGNAQAYLIATSSGTTALGATATAWSVGSGGDWEMLNGGAGYSDTSYANGFSIVSSHASGSIKFVTGGKKNSNIRGKVGSTGTWAFNYNDNTTATEVIQVKAGNIKLDGTSGTHGIIFPNGTNQQYPFVVAGSSGTVQFNNGSNVLGGDTLLTWDNSAKRLGVNVAAPTEKLHVKTGNIRIEGTSGVHGIIFPDSSTQTSAAVAPTDYSGWSLAYTTTNDDQDVETYIEQHAVAIGPVMIISFHCHLTSVTSIGTGTIAFAAPNTPATVQRVPATITDGFNTYPAMWDPSSGLVYYINGGVLAEVTVDTPFGWGINTGIDVNGSYFY